LRAGGQEFDVADGESGSAPETGMVERERGRGTRELVLASVLAAGAMPFASPFARSGYQSLRFVGEDLKAKILCLVFALAKENALSLVSCQ
jgi:hypothetical protein